MVDGIVRAHCPCGPLWSAPDPPTRSVRAVKGERRSRRRRHLAHPLYTIDTVIATILDAAGPHAKAIPVRPSR